MDKLPGDTGVQPRAIFQGEDIQDHGFGLPGGSDNNYVVGWTRLSERRALLPTKLDAPTGQSKIPGLTRERERVQRQVTGLYAEAINKLNRDNHFKYLYLFEFGCNQSATMELFFQKDFF